MRLLYLNILLAFALPSLNAQNINMKTKTGQDSYFNIHSLKKITFKNDTMQVYVASETIPEIFSLSNLQCVYFGDSALLNHSYSIIDNQDILKIYPNPACEYLILEHKITITNNSAVQLSIYSMDGKKILERIINNQNNRIQIPLLGISKGLYVARIRYDEIFYSGKFIKN